jgi:hypothetical protein
MKMKAAIFVEPGRIVLDEKPSESVEHEAAEPSSRPSDCDHLRLHVLGVPLRS